MAEPFWQWETASTRALSSTLQRSLVSWRRLSDSGSAGRSPCGQCGPALSRAVGRNCGSRLWFSLRFRLGRLVHLCRGRVEYEVTARKDLFSDASCGYQGKVLLLLAHVVHEEERFAG